MGRNGRCGKTFGTLARSGLETNNLSVKFLFKPGSTDFLADPKISAAYPMWLAADRAQAAQIDSCVVVDAARTSRTGSEAVNERLSLQRAGERQEPACVRRGAAAVEESCASRAWGFPREHRGHGGRRRERCSRPSASNSKVVSLRKA